MGTSWPDQPDGARSVVPMSLRTVQVRCNHLDLVPSDGPHCSTFVFQKVTWSGVNGALGSTWNLLARDAGQQLSPVESIECQTSAAIPVEQSIVHVRADTNAASVGRLAHPSGLRVGASIGHGHYGAIGRVAVVRGRHSRRFFVTFLVEGEDEAVGAGTARRGGHE